MNKRDISECNEFDHSEQEDIVHQDNKKARSVPCTNPECQHLAARVKELEAELARLRKKKLVIFI
jgi:hypothetical protein